MASKFKVGDLIWAKMKGFPAWPGKVIAPKDGVERKKKQYVYFFGSENYAWIMEEQVWHYVQNRTRFLLTSRIPKGFKEAIEAIDDAVKNMPEDQRKDMDERATAPEKKESPKPVKAKTPVSNVGRPRKRPSSPGSSISSSTKKGKLMTVKKTPPKRKDDKMSESNRHWTSILNDKPITPSNNQVDYLEYLKEISNKTDERSPSPHLDSQGGNATTNKGNIIATPLKIGFLGLGIMGSGMVSNLLASGHEVTVWNRTPSKCKEFVKQGALKANSPAEVVQGCDITFSCVSDPSALKDLVFGNCGVLQGIGPGKAYIDMSTVDTETVADIHEAVTARGGRFLEAPVIGSKQPAAEGHLVILSSGDKSLYEDCYTAFQAMGRRTFYLGEIGSATKMKLITGLIMGTVIGGLAEALALAEKIGLDQEEVMQILDLSPISCSLIRSKGTAMINSNFSDAHCKLQTFQKDMRLAVNMSDAVDQPLHVTSAVNELYKKAKAKGYGEHDTAAVYRAAAL